MLGMRGAPVPRVGNSRTSIGFSLPLGPYLKASTLLSPLPALFDSAYTHPEADALAGAPSTIAATRIPAVRRATLAMCPSLLGIEYRATLTEPEGRAPPLSRR